MLEEWPRQFPNFDPIAHELKVAFARRWVRFHGLPESKRYPETGPEYATVLDRHNRILGELVTSGEKVVLLTTGYSLTRDVVPPPAELRSLTAGARLWRSVPMDDRDGFAEPTTWHIFADEWAWHPGLFDPIVRLVADDVVSNLMIVAPDCRWLLHPYDGGMDVILDSPAARDSLRAAHLDWLSFRADGM